MPFYSYNVGENDTQFFCWSVPSTTLYSFHYPITMSIFHEHEPQLISMNNWSLGGGEALLKKVVLEHTSHMPRAVINTQHF